MAIKSLANIVAVPRFVAFGRCEVIMSVKVEFR